MTVNRRVFLLGAATLATCSMAPAAFALTDQRELVEEARITFEKLTTSSDFAELPSYLKQAKAVMIFPNLFKAGFGIGGEGGTGVLMVRGASGGWSAPAFYTLAAGSLGLQVDLDRAMTGPGAFARTWVT